MKARILVCGGEIDDTPFIELIEESGANVFAALEVARKLGKGKTIVTILPDRGERYLSMNLF